MRNPSLPLTVMPLGSLFPRKLPLAVSRLVPKGSAALDPQQTRRTMLFTILLRVLVIVTWLRRTLVERVRTMVARLHMLTTSLGRPLFLLRIRWQAPPRGPFNMFKV